MSLLQRSLGIGYGRAARLIDYMAEDGIVGSYNGSQAREILISVEDWEAMSGQGPPETPPPPQEPPRRAKKILLAPEPEIEEEDAFEAPSDADTEAEEDYEEDDCEEEEYKEDEGEEYEEEPSEEEEEEYEEDAEYEDEELDEEEDCDEEEQTWTAESA